MFDINWDDGILLIYFIYGLAFYSLGLALFVESGRSSEFGFARSMRLLAGFGVLHGTHEWLDLVEVINERFYSRPLPEWLVWLKLSVLITSFVALVAFGEHLLAREGVRRSPTWLVTGGLLAFYFLSAVVSPLVYTMTEAEWQKGLDVLARYILCIPGAFISCLALWQQRKTFIRRQMAVFASDLNWGILALFLYGFVGQAFPPQSPIFPSMHINSALFLERFGFPVQLLRAILASVLAISLIAVLRALEFESQKRVEDIVQRKAAADRKQAIELARLNSELRAASEETRRLLDEVRKRDARRGELLLHITAAQEAERQRIARELHDETGQVLTGLALGLRGVSSMVAAQPETASEKLADLEQMATGALTGLRHLINDLRPPQLDDMGLVAALRFMRERLAEFNHGTLIDVVVHGTPYTFPQDVEIALFRIAQEGMTNAVRHAQASHITVELDYRDCPILTIRDDGRGFDPEAILDAPERAAWGLHGVQERANLINAELKIESAPGAGTTLEVRLRDIVDERL